MNVEVSCLDSPVCEKSDVKISVTDVIQSIISIL